MNHEYAFDVKLVAVIRIQSPSKALAIAELTRHVDCLDLCFTLTDADSRIEITEASLSLDDADFPYLFEVDGEPVD